MEAITMAILEGGRIEIEKVTMPAEPFYEERQMIRVRLRTPDGKITEGHHADNIVLAFDELAENLGVDMSPPL